VVPTPGKGTMIENFFDPSLLATKLDGKSFNPLADVDTNTQYGKKIFAERVVQPNQATIDFDGFQGILQRFVAVIEHHKAKIGT
jgi:hypothetical protein